MPKPRDYKSEYQRRIDRGLARGLSRSQARGHPAKAESSASGVKAVVPTPELEAALKSLRRGSTQKGAAARVGVSVERFRRFLYANGLAEREGRAWIITDDRPRRVQIIHQGESRSITVPTFTDAQKAGAYHNAVGEFLRSNDLTWLERFDGDGVTDMRGRFFTFDTDPNALYRHAASDELPFYEIYEIVAT